MRFWIFSFCLCFMPLGMMACGNSQNVNNDNNHDDDDSADGSPKDEGDADDDTQGDQSTQKEVEKGDGTEADSETGTIDSEATEISEDSEKSSDSVWDTAETDTDTDTGDETVTTDSGDIGETDTDTDTASESENDTEDDTEDDSEDDSDDDSENDSDVLPECGLDQTPDENGFVLMISKNVNRPNVAVVEWCSVAQPDKAFIEFGLDTSYGMIAPVDLDEHKYRTLLLGMKTFETYHLRVVVESGGNTFKSADYVFESGPVFSMSWPAIEVRQPDKTAGGFIVLAAYTANAMSQNPMALIFDADGELVWGQYASLLDSSAARMSYDGKTMAVISSNYQGDVGGIELFSMDGLSSETLDISGAAHDLTPTPDNGFAYLEYAPDGGMISTACAKVMKVDAQGGTEAIFDTADTWGDNCHATSLRYNAVHELFTVSDYEHQEIVAFDESGSVAWVTQNDGLWEYAHGHQLLGDSLLVFENGGSYSDGFPQSSVKEFGFADTAGGVELVWEYTVADLGTPTFGDVQRLPGGNTLVAYSNKAIIHEVDADGALVKIWDFGQTAFGYISWRPTLYGPPESLKP